MFVTWLGFFTTPSLDPRNRYTAPRPSRPPYGAPTARSGGGGADELLDEGDDDLHVGACAREMCTLRAGDYDAY